MAGIAWVMPATVIFSTMPRRILFICAMAALACRDQQAAAKRQQAHVDSVVASGGLVDSALTIAEHLRRFRDDVGPNPDTLRHASRTPEALVRRWATAVAANDTVALRRLVVDRAEFAWLFYEDTRMSKPPYEMPPGLLWSQLSGNGDDGMRAVLRILGGRQLQVSSFRCPAPPDTEGRHVLRQGCLVGLRVGAESRGEDRYFGSIIERDGRFKFLGFSNRL